MKEIVIGANDAGQRLDRFLAKAVPLLPPPELSPDAPVPQIIKSFPPPETLIIKNVNVPVP